MPVLNEFLYKRLKTVFGSVKLSNQGQPMIAEDKESPWLVDWSWSDVQEDPSLYHLEVVQTGEEYRVCCPYCPDTRHRLFINHMFGKRSSSGRKLNFLAVCFNEACMLKERNRDDFRETLSVRDADLEKAHVRKVTKTPSNKTEAFWPGPCKPLHELTENHPARKYIKNRKFDPDKLSKLYDVRFCSDSIYMLARNRIIVPINWQGKLVGWQARHIGELPWKDKKKKKDLPPKYYTMPGTPKGTILPNFDKARHYRTGVLVEGWFDVFSFGPMAMPILGNTVTEEQRKLFSNEFGMPGRSGILMLDPEEQESRTTEMTVKRLSTRMEGKLAVVWLPEGTDPGKLDRSFLRDYAREQAEEQEVKVRYRKV